jgi:hypothetical protein
MEPNIAEMLRSTAKNMSELFHMLATRVEQLEQENQELREKLEQK